ncbi:MAG TPA: TonB-dependent receptor [Caulobacteraceae bacterium]|nr:TonB-dependent receptor [Caulobacteraceae bacterium]
MPKSLLLGTSVLALSAAIAAPALAADAAANPSSAQVIVTGTRSTAGLKAVDSPAPVQVVGGNAFKVVGQQDVMQVLSQTLPSFNAQGYGADTSQLTLSAALRGLNPDDTLVLVDGKRRHTTADLAVDGGSPYQGSATTDLTFIPVGAIDHIEVLQDGAAAQYGSDAIAGVVNIILKNSPEAGVISATAGQYYEGDGTTGAWSINKGFALGDNGFINLTAEERYHDFSQQGGPDQRLFNPNGALKASDNPIDAAGVVHAPGYPDVNHIYGDPQYNVYNLFYNGGYNITPDVELYSFGSYGHRDISAFENYRVPTKVEGVTSLGALVVPLPNGFDPREQITEDDYSFTGGIKGVVSGWNWDLSTTYGGDTDAVATVDSANKQLFPVLQAASATPIIPQRDFTDGQFATTEWTSNLDIDKQFNVGMASPLDVAFGAEYQQDSFSIQAGEPSSYFGAGAQSFTGYGPTDAGKHTRSDEAVYIDLSGDPLANLHLDVAGRYANFSDFGDTVVGKFTARYDFSPMIAIRGTISNGFRAPTLAEEFYSGTNVSPSFAQVQLPPNSPAAKVAGFGPLKPEKSDNYSIGIVLHPVDRLQITADAYEIDITDRIVGSGFLLGSEQIGVVNHIISQAVLNAITAHGNTLDSGISYAGIQLFTNGVNTRTDGAEVTASYSSDFGDMGHVDWSAGFNWNQTTVTKVAPLPAVDVNVPFGQTKLLTKQAISALTTMTPREKVVVGAYWTLDRWSVNLRETVYGPTSEWISINQTGSGRGATNFTVPTNAITDLDIGFKVTPQLRLNVGANNLFDTRPPGVPNVPNGSGGVQPADGNNVYGEPAQFSPWGIDGGYYYGRVTFTF